jgi:hypothetical protein
VRGRAYCGLPEFWLMFLLNKEGRRLYTWSPPRSCKTQLTSYLPFRFLPAPPHPLRPPTSLGREISESLKGVRRLLDRAGVATASASDWSGPCFYPPLGLTGSETGCRQA